MQSFPLPGAVTDRDATRLRVRVLPGPRTGSTLADDVRRGLLVRPKRLPPKHFYDATGSWLFDRICDTPEYYPTRTELALLEERSDDLLGRFEPTDIVELGSGTARKTRALFRAAERAGIRVRYVPFDVSESMLIAAGEELVEEFPWLEVDGLVGDYERHLAHLPAGRRRLILFIGGTIGNFEHEEAVRFLRGLADSMGDDDRLLLGTDLVKSVDVLDAAYNDALGVTAAFNKNLLTVMNRELGANFELERFEHVAFFDREKSQIEMHLRSLDEHRVSVRKLGCTIPFSTGETIHTEISRKFTREGIASTLSEAGLELLEWHTPPSEYFALSLSRRCLS